MQTQKLGFTLAEIGVFLSKAHSTLDNRLDRKTGILEVGPGQTMALVKIGREWMVPKRELERFLVQVGLAEPGQLDEMTRPQPQPQPQPEPQPQPAIKRRPGRPRKSTVIGFAGFGQRGL